MKLLDLGKKTCLLYLILLILSSIYLIISLGILQSGFFIWDDDHFLFHKLITEYHFTSLLDTSHYGMYHPVTSLWVKINYLIHVNNPQILHLQSICIHIINGWLVFAILRKLGFNNILGFSIFLFHPLNTEVVFWLTSIKDLLFGFFTLISIYFYIIYKYNDNNKYYKLTFIASILAILSKPQAIVIPFILLTIDFCFDSKTYRKLILQKLPLFIISALVVYINLNIRNTDKDLSSLYNYDFVERLLIVCYSFNQHVLALIFPINQSIFYPLILNRNISHFLPYTIIPLIYIFSLYFAFQRKQKIIIAILLTFLFFALPVMQIIPIGESVYNDRYSYLQTFVLAVAAESCILGLKSRYKLNAVIIPVIVVVCFLMLNMFQQRERLWEKRKDLFLSAFEFNPQSEIITNTLGVILLRENSNDSALFFFDKATKIKPDYAQAYYNKGIAYEKKQQIQMAINQYKRAIDLKSTYQESHFRLSQIYYNKANYDSAELTINQVIRLKVANAEALDLYGKILYQKGNLRKSIKYYEAALKLDDDNAQYLYNLAVSVGYLGDYQRAFSLLKTSITINPNFSEGYYLLGIVEFKLGKDGCPNLMKASLLGNQMAGLAIEEFCK